MAAQRAGLTQALAPSSDMPSASKILFVAAVSALLLAVVWPVSAEKEQRLYAAAALRVIQAYPPSITLHTRDLGDGNSIVTYGIPPNAIPYKSLSEFYAENPHCCELVDRAADGWQPSLLDRLFGLHSYIVRVRYSIRHIGPDGTVRTIPDEAFIILKRSGKVTHI